MDGMAENCVLACECMLCLRVYSGLNQTQTLYHRGIVCVGAAKYARLFGYKSCARTQHPISDWRGRCGASLTPVSADSSKNMLLCERARAHNEVFAMGVFQQKKKLANIKSRLRIWRASTLTMCFFFRCQRTHSRSVGRVLAQ